MTSGSVERALRAAQEWLIGLDAPEAVIAAHEAGLSGDTADARRWARRILDGQGSAGAWDDDVTATAGALLTLAEIRTAASLREQDPGIGRALDWLRARRGVPGAWSDGCSEDRHRLGICHHFLGGFFSPGPPEVAEDETHLRSGVRAVGDAEVRFVASAAALRALLEWAPPTRDARLHLEGLRRVVALWPERPPPGLSTASLLAAVHALLLSPVDEDREAAGRGLRVLAGKQRGDGSWVETDPFQALEVFARAASVGVASGASAQRALARRAAPGVVAEERWVVGRWGGRSPGPYRLADLADRRSQCSGVRRGRVNAATAPRPAAPGRARPRR